MSVKVLGLTEVCQVLVVDEDLNWERRSMEVVPPGFQGLDDHEEFSVIHVIVTLGRDEGLGEIGTGMPVAIQVCLEENST